MHLSPELGISPAIVGAAIKLRQNFSALMACFGVCTSAKSWYNSSAVRPMATGVSGDSSRRNDDLTPHEDGS